MVYQLEWPYCMFSPGQQRSFLRICMTVNQRDTIESQTHRLHFHHGVSPQVSCLIPPRQASFCVTARASFYRPAPPSAVFLIFFEVLPLPADPPPLGCQDPHLPGMALLVIPQHSLWVQHYHCRIWVSTCSPCEHRCSFLAEFEIRNLFYCDRTEMSQSCLSIHIDLNLQTYQPMLIHLDFSFCMLTYPDD